MAFEANQYGAEDKPITFKQRDEYLEVTEVSPLLDSLSLATIESTSARLSTTTRDCAA